MSNLGISPLWDLVVIEPQEKNKRKTSGGVIIPRNNMDEPKRGTVLLTGKGINGNGMSVRIGNTVLYGEYSGSPTTINGKDLLLMRETDIFAILNEENQK